MAARATKQTAGPTKTVGVNPAAPGQTAHLPFRSGPASRPRLRLQWGRTDRQVFADGSVGNILPEGPWVAEPSRRLGSRRMRLGVRRPLPAWARVAGVMFGVGWGANQFSSLLFAYRLHRGVAETHG